MPFLGPADRQPVLSARILLAHQAGNAELKGAAFRIVFGSVSNTQKICCSTKQEQNIINGVTEDYQSEDWVALYQAALLELEQAKISGRITVARDAIVARMEKLCAMPGLHSQERQAIEDALHALKCLQREETRFNAEAGQRAVENSLENLRSIRPTIQRLGNNAESE